MATYSRQLLSGTPASGRVIQVAATATPGTLIHTAVTGVNSFDELYLWATNVTGSPVVLSIEWGGVLAPGDHLIDSYSIPPHSAPIPIATGQVIADGLVIGAAAGTTNAINISGYVNRITG